MTRVSWLVEWPLPVAGVYGHYDKNVAVSSVRYDTHALATVLATNSETAKTRTIQYVT